jgi:phosphatidate cytidylyltransferase
MQRVITAVVLVPLVVLAVFRAPFWLYGLIITIIALMATREYLRLADAHHLQPLKTLTYFAILAVLGDYYLQVVLRGLQPATLQGRDFLHNPVAQYELALLLTSLAPFVLLVACMRSTDLRQALPSAAVSYMGVPYIGISLGFLLFTRALIADGAFAVFYMLLVVWTGDICAYYVGRSLGRHRLAPRVSPGKSWEGTIASVLGSTAVGTLLLMFNGPIADRLYQWKLLVTQSVLSSTPHPAANAIWLAIAASLSINVAAQLGDLVESTIKRGAEAKDSGTLLPGHGGVLDRIDALLLASPVLWYYCSFRLVHF